MKKGFLTFLGNAKDILFCLTFLILGLSLFSSCGDDSEGRIKLNDVAPAQVTNVQQEAGPGEIYFTWNIPSSESFMYTKVTYTTSKGEEKYLLFSKDHADKNGVMKATVSGFANTDPVKFLFYACSVHGNSQQPVEVEGIPGTPAFALMAESIDITPDYGGVQVSWKNESVASVFVVLEYQAKSDASKAGSIRFSVEANSESSRFVPFSYGEGDVLSGEACDVKVYTQDSEENSSDIRTFETIPLKVNKMDRSSWTFPGFKDTCDGTVGYSSQEPKEGGYPQGRVVAMLDGDTNTYWHSSWSMNTVYPHFFIVDMGKDVMVSNVSLRRRTGNSNSHTGQTFYTCTEAGVTNPSNSEAWAWDNQGWFSFDPTTDVTQVYKLNTPKMARYLKVYFAASDRGLTDWCFLSELNIFEPAEN
ncbi:DUF4959 domain-containing protein [uncultured Bacteroides sp.]|uniref:DUF4959 domain-containing protein n=1 Tax=uncultured Bacteroides sp. TaxID=162156 RepID=UPI002596D95F|nr:DUF4959 domain-containing protein [uncultured Bacteroides sp.]